MEYKHIDLLLEKYWAGESSLEEEKTLQLYFKGERIAERHLSFVPLFQFFVAEQEQELSENFDQKLLHQLTGVEGSASKIVLLKKKASRKITYVFRIAAAIALLLSLWFLFPKTADPKIAEVDQQELEEAKITYQQAKAALLLLSKKMNTGTQTALKGINELEEATKVVRTK